MGSASSDAISTGVQKDRKRKIAYISASAGLLLAGFIFGPVRNPFGSGFLRFSVPLVLLLNSVQWFAISLKIRHQITGALCSLLAGIGCAFSYTPAGFPNFTTIIILGLFAQGATMWFFAADWGEKSIVVTQHLAIGFVVLVGADLKARGIALHLGDVSSGTAAFLFWSPLLTALMWASSVIWREHKKETLIVVVCGVAQAGIGLFDLGMSFNVRWGLPCAVVAWFAALGLAAYLAKTWKVG